MVVQMPPMTSTGVPQASSRCLGGIDMLSDLRFGLRLSAHSVSEWTSDASSVADRDDRQQPLMESVCDNGLVKDIHMASHGKPHPVCRVRSCTTLNTSCRVPYPSPTLQNRSTQSFGSRVLIHSSRKCEHNLNLERKPVVQSERA